MKTMTKLGLAVILFIATAVFNSAMAQKYGGSAYVHVKDDEGKKRVLNVTIFANENSESDAKSKLKREIDALMRNTNEEYVGQIWYGIDRVDYWDKKYGGTATVRVKDKNTGKERQINVDIYCNEKSIPNAKDKLLFEINSIKSNYEEDFISGVSYDIDSCN